ncbi:MAG: PAS domain-containing sensor histidine kinase [Clostridia bacterium]|nr:PAS domain-containing sensor histidine kinase [Clostridia bacterium]
MTRRIFRNILLTAVLALLLTSALLVGTLYNVYEGRISAELRTEAAYIVRALNMLPDDRTYFTDFSPDNRVTLIAPDGSVLYDSDADEARMDSHAQRPEVLAALADGTGESTRYSDTLSEVTIYYARRTADGNVLRIASTRSSALGVFLSVAPQIVIMLLMVAALSLLIARFASRQIVQPINDLNLDEPLENDVYDELAPLLTRMDRQHGQIRQQMYDLARAHADLNAIMANMREGLILLNKESRIISINHSAQTIFGVKGVIASDADLLTICRDASVLEIVKAAQQGDSGDVVMPRDSRTYRIFASPVLREDRVRGVVLLALDISARYAAEASRREFTANVSHELKTPLTSISGYAEIIESGIAKTEDVPAFAGKIRAEAKRLVALVNDILQLSRLDEKQGMGAKEHVALLPMLNDLADSFAPIAAEKSVALSIEGCEATVEGYPVLLRELFHNLIDNAIKYTPAGGSVTVRLARQDGHIRCTVKDTGIGIPQEHQAHVFERFYRVDKSHSRPAGIGSPAGGTGLGLAIVKHVAEVHQAQVHLESRPQEGTAVSVIF